MPGTTRYSATFDRTYEEEAKPSSPPNARRSRSQSWQANSGHDGRQYTPFASRSPAPRSSSTDNNLSNGTEFIPTRTAKTSVKAHNNPFQFVKVGTCPLYKKAEEQLKKAKETKKPDVLKEEEEEWQTNLDSWKSRRRKMSEDVFRRQEELKLLELEEQIAQVSNKKTKTFSEMVESRATRGRALSLCLLTSPLEFQNWEFENKAHKSGSCSFTDESGENSIVNSEDEGVSVRGRHEENSINENAMNHRTNGDAHIEQNGTALDKQNGNCNKLSNNVQMKTKENSYIDSGLESISSSHRAGDTPDSGSDFSQDSNSSIDCDSPRTGVNVLEEFSSKSSQISEGHEIRIILKLDEKGQDFGFTFLGGKDEGQVIIASILEGSKAESSGIHLGDRIIMIDGCDVNSKKHIEIAALIQKAREKNQMSLLLWRHTKTTNGTNGFIAEAKHNKVITDENFNAKSYEKSIESENEMFVDDFEELKRQSELLANKKSVAANAQANGNKHSNKDAISLKTSSESSTAPIPKINTSNSAVEEPNKNEEKTEINSENQKKNIIKVKRVRRKGVYALNVDSNQISQDGNSTNTLFPLSPVTELPSPADETKTMSSTLSSNITLPVSNSQNGFSDEGKQKNAENIKSNIPVSKENNSVIPTSASTENSKSATLQTDSKNVENKIKLNTENEIEIANSPTLSSKNKDSQDEKPKSQPTPKKIKASKLKKGMSSENTSAASECTNELTSITQCGDVTSETVFQEKPSSESKSSHSENKQLSIKNVVKNVTALESMESNISSKNTSVKPATEIISVPTKTPSTAVSNGIGIQSPKVVANSIKAPTTSIPPKLLTSEDSKPKKNIQKKVIAKSKGMALENTSAASECTNELTSVTQCEDVTSETVIQDKSSSESKSSHLENKQLSIKNDVKNLTALESMESNISSKNIPVKPATETISVPTKTPSSAVSNGIGIQSPKVVANSIKVPTTSIPPKLSTSEDSKPKKNIQKKVIAKSKGMALENTSAASECTNELTSVTQCEDVTSETVIQDKSSSESKSSHLENKQLSIKNDVKNLTALESMESNISSKNIPVKPATETISVPTKTPSSAVSNGIGIQSPKVVANSIKVPTTSIPPKLSTSEDSKPKKNIQKKVIAKSKGMALENTSAASECTNELTSVTQCEDVTSETVIQEKSSSESKSSHLENKQLSIKNDVKNLTALESMESNISSKNIPVKPATETISVPTKTPCSAVSNGIGIQSPKVVANSIKVPTTSIPPKLSTSEDSKPKKNIQKKVIAKSKGMALENTSATSEYTNELTSVTQCEDVTSETVIQEKSSSESKSSHLENKQLSIKNDVKNLTALESMESNISSKNIPVKPATETISVPTKTPCSAVSNGIGIQSPKVVANSIKVPTTSIPPKLSTSEDSKPKKNIQKKVIAKSKGMALENTSATSEYTNELTSVTQCEDVTSETVIQEKSSSESKSSHLENKQLSIKNDVKNLTALESMDNITEKTSCGTSTNSTLNEIYSTKEQSSSIVEKQEKVDSKNEIAVSPLKEESNISLNGIANAPQETKQSPIDETSIPCPSTNKVRDLTLKFGVKKPSMSSEYSIPSKNAKALKSPVNEKTKPGVVEKKESTKAKENCVEQNLIGSPVALSSVSNSFDSSSKNTSLSNKDKQIKIAVKDEIIIASSKMGNSDVQAPIGNKQVTTKSSTSSVSNASDSQSSKNPVKEIQLTKEKKSTSLSQDEQIKTMVKNDIKVSPLTREKGMLSLDIGVNDATAVDKQSHKLPSPVVPANNPTSIVTPVNKSESDIVSPEISVTKNSIPKSPVNSPDEKPKLPIPKRSRNRSKKKSANSQKVNTPAKLNEESKISNDSLNVVFQSQPKSMGSENITNNKNFENNINRTAISTDLVTDVPPVDKIAEEMEKLILEQLEEEERAKELSTGKVLVESSPEHLLTAPPRLAEPPKEKPPPPPSTESPKDSSLKRVNSTKRIKKEIYKRRSNFLGIENADESIICSESSVPPPPALEEILKAEMELDRQTRLRIENEATERLTLEEKEIMQKEREIIESLESEERRKMYMNGTEECNSVYMSNSTSDAVCEQGHIESLKCERKRIDTELQLSEEQQQILIEEKQLKEREEFIRQQEAAISTASLSDSSLSVSANTANNLKKPALSSVPTKVQSNGLLLGTNGDGSGLALSSSTEVSMNETSKGGKKIKASEKPAVPPKPLKKEGEEAIRKERERLRQEQEALQREREEHRRKLMLEQEELMKQQKNHAPDAPASRLGPHPPQIQPSFPPQLTTTMNATPNARENASFPSRSHHGTSNTAAGSLNAVELMGPPVVRQNVRPAPRKAAQNEAWGQQKMPSVRKQNHESLPESRYNQNHWLIQEAEMRRIAELKERQRTTQTPCTQTHLAEDDVCSNPPRVPVISPTHNPHLNYPVQEKVWNYGQSNMPLKKYPPPVVKEPPLHTIYPRETVPQQPPTKPSRVVPSERQEQMLSVSGRKRCSHCNEELGRGAAMIIESLQLYYHIHCFQCCVCQAQLGNGSCGTDVRVRNNKLHCHNCYSNDEAGLKFSQV